MKSFYTLEDLICDEDFCEEFCEGCAGLRLVRNYPDEPDYYECRICGGDISDSSCLKASYYDDIKLAFEYLETAINEALSHTGDSRFRDDY